MRMVRLLDRFRRRWRRQKRSLQERFPQYAIGRGSYGDLTVRSWKEGTTLTIGAYCSIAAGVKVFLGGEHRADWVTTFPFPAIWPADAGHITGHPRSRGDVVIGNDVWLGTEAMIMSGVTIGDGAVVGARAVVTRDVPPYAIVAGNPARIVRYRFDPVIIARLLRARWWHWSDDRIRTYLPLLLSDDPTRFLDAAEADTPGGERA
ncbi:CatB-related O-acetyltransferase [Thauera chlorobenzoica]|uniref:Chloramphenicol acetyltransferase n=1 Tax=Thauera chlorobenzoica TaxID=96773 RepID=A0A1H5SXG8_9RHOO|nr:CatB-related O-acetyltransferase [Thauera chlorobenzoica]APR04067.1 Chloramphenicol acetyltransferase [Thauera chlorobenzoica]SEF55164.1 Acetyltransferase (isoleucine patch superfamily) [Thauera chlorobenzoica]